MKQEENRIGKNIKKFRNIAGLTQKELAEKCGFATITIRQYENGAREPKTKQQDIICSVLDIPPLALLTGTTDNEYNDSFALGITDALSIYENANSHEEGISNMLKEILVSNFDMLNRFGKEKAIEQVELLTKIPEYKKDPGNDNQNQE